MADLDVSIEYYGKGEDISVIQATGYIDTVTAPELEKMLQELMNTKKFKIVINLKSISYVSSAGWGIFVSELRDIRENSGDLVLAEMSPDVYDVYELMEFSSILRSFDTINDALKNFGFISEEKPAVPVIDTAAQQPSVESAPVSEQAVLSINDKINMIIKENPYFQEKQIRAELNSPRYSNEKVGFFEIKKILKDMGLDDSKKRYNFAMKQKN
ncbi:MAG: STAS domain-containing protein [Spirochaetes bacterium]|nr:STAS domain-containing protein [Spirochaetota bacterium]